jgi:hypothetical protein
LLTLRKGPHPAKHNEARAMTAAQRMRAALPKRSSLSSPRAERRRSPRPARRPGPPSGPSSRQKPRRRREPRPTHIPSLQRLSDRYPKVATSSPSLDAPRATARGASSSLLNCGVASHMWRAVAAARRSPCAWLKKTPREIAPAGVPEAIACPLVEISPQFH